MAYCIFTENGAITEIPHNAEETGEAQPCDGLGCFERIVEYKAHPDQLESLIQLSHQCSQSLTFDCFKSPLRINENDRLSSNPMSLHYSTT